MSSQTASGALIQPYRVYRDFLAPQDHAAMLTWALENEARFVPAKVGREAVNPEIRQSLSLRDLGPLKSLLKQRVRDLVPLLCRDLPAAPFPVLGVELELVAHNDGAHYIRHIDTHTYNKQFNKAMRGDRVLSGAYYFYREPRAFSGGELRLHKMGSVKDGGHFPDIVPEQNSFVGFHSWWPHEVRPVKCPSRDFADSRFAVNCWVYRPKPGNSGESRDGQAPNPE